MPSLALQTLISSMQNQRIPERDQKLMQIVVNAINWVDSDKEKQALRAENQYHTQCAAPASRGIGAFKSCSRTTKPGSVFTKYLPREIEDFLMKLNAGDQQGYQKATISKICTAILLLTRPAKNYARVRYLPKGGVQNIPYYNQSIAKFDSLETIAARNAKPKCATSPSTFSMARTLSVAQKPDSPLSRTGLHYSLDLKK